MSSFSQKSFFSSAFSAASFFIEQFTPTATRGGVADFRHYQKKLRKIAEAADRRLYGKVKRRVNALAKQELPPVIKKRVAEIQVDLSAVINTAAENQHKLLLEQIKKLDLLIEQFILEQHKREEEVILFLLMA